MEGYCDIVSDMCDGWCDLYRENTRTARKEHRCSECGRVIEPGEKYRQARSLCDGYWYSAKTCRFCAAAWALVCPRGLRVDGGLVDCLVEIDNDSSQPPPWLRWARAGVGCRWGKRETERFLRSARAYAKTLGRDAEAVKRWLSLCD